MTIILFILALIFAIRIVFIIKFHPAIMGDKKTIKTPVKKLWATVRICRTAGFGKPSLKLRPAKRSVYLHLEFHSPTNVNVTLPLKLAKQQKAKTEYIELISSYGFDVTEFSNANDIDVLSFNADRTDKGLGKLIETLYMQIFKAGPDHIVNFTVDTLHVDMPLLEALGHEHYSPLPDETLEASSASYTGKSITLYPDTPDIDAHEKEPTSYDPDDTLEAASAQYIGKTIRQVQTTKILNAVYFLFYPLLITLAYKCLGIYGMCWAAFIFFGLYTLRGLVNYKRSVLGTLLDWDWVYCGLLAATLITQDIKFLTLIPVAIGIVTAISSAAMLLNIISPRSKNHKSMQKKDPRQFSFMMFMLCIGGIALAFAGQWARQNLSLDAWVKFFAFIRIEFMIGLVVIFILPYTLYLSKYQHKTAQEQEPS